MEDNAQQINLAFDTKSVQIGDMYIANVDIIIIAVKDYQEGTKWNRNWFLIEYSETVYRKILAGNNLLFVVLEAKRDYFKVFFPLTNISFYLRKDVFGNSNKNIQIIKKLMQ